jgi:hypothetical protein
MYTRVFAACYFRQYMPNKRPVLGQQPQRSRNPILAISPEEGNTTSQNWDDFQKYHSESFKIYLFLKTFGSFFITTILFFILHIQHCKKVQWVLGTYRQNTTEAATPKETVLHLSHTCSD